MEFDFLVLDHPWVPQQQHSPYARSVLGAVATVTERVGLIIRYHPAVVAQKAATMGVRRRARNG